MYHFRGGVYLRQQLRSLLAVLIRVLLEIHIVKQTAQSPEVRVFPLFLGKPAHDSFHGQGMLNVKRFVVVFLQQSQSLLPGQIH